ncbi:LuxR C-terminal-related transcriptional regulator [Streptomyces sp. NPDC058045]|uniref:helix-turn-helix transcriptional regulator n=1 Tax=Streptomyces sp. NPDC058045 TaxID=3346311 RepID=UPI0036E1858D
MSTPDRSPAPRATTHPHGVEELCEAGTELYAEAVRAGGIDRPAAAEAPCLVEFGLLHPDRDDDQRLLPTSPAVTLPRLLRTMEDDIARRRRRETTLADVFERFLTSDQSPGASSGVTALRGLERIDSAIGLACATASVELLTIQPGGKRSPDLLAGALPREQGPLSRGARMRTLYQHTARHSPPVLAHYEQLRGDVQVRTLDEVTDRMIMVDRACAYIPLGTGDTDALEIRHPGLLRYLAVMFERFWRLAEPMWPVPGPAPRQSAEGVTSRQLAIAQLLVEGLTDERIALRLGMNVRTVRVHIAKLAATLGSGNRAQLGYLIGRSGILQEDR